MDDKRLQIDRLYNVYAPILSHRQRDVLEQYYREDYSLSEIAENLGITRQGVRDALKHGEEALFFYEEALGFSYKKEKVELLARMIVDSADEQDTKKLAEEILNGI